MVSIELRYYLFVFLAMLPCEAAKQLVIITGGQQEGVNEFFYRTLIEKKADKNYTTGLNGWSWPSLKEKDIDLLENEGIAIANRPKYDVYDLLFREKGNSLVQQVLLETIREYWKNSTHGIIIGEERFAHVGKTPSTSDDALKVIYKLMESLSLGTKDVTLVLLYSTPRVQEWASLWKEHSMYGTYEDFLCKDTEADKRLEIIDTIMNPLKVASSYRSQGLNVVVVDQEGVKRSGLDPAHAIACSVLGDVDCENGWIAGWKEETSRYPPIYEISELDDSDSNDLERLFQARDCCYQTDPKFVDRTDGFRILNRHALWRDCQSQCNAKFLKTAMYAESFFSAVQSQKDCGDHLVTVSDLLRLTETDMVKNRGWKILFLLIVPGSIALGLIFVGIVKHRSKQVSTDDSDIPLFPKWMFARWNWIDRTRQDTRLAEQGGRNKPFLCNACKFVHVDPNCVFCHNRRHLDSSDIGKEVERRIQQLQRAASTDTSGENFDDVELQENRPNLRSDCPLEYDSRQRLPVSSIPLGLSYSWPGITSPNSQSTTTALDASQFDMNLRNTKSQSKKKRRAKREKRKATLKDLLVSKNENGERIYKVSESRTIPLRHPLETNNLQTIVLEEDDNNRFA